MQDRDRQAGRCDLFFLLSTPPPPLSYPSLGFTFSFSRPFAAPDKKGFVQQPIGYQFSLQNVQGVDVIGPHLLPVPLEFKHQQAGVRSRRSPREEEEEDPPSPRFPPSRASP